MYHFDYGIFTDLEKPQEIITRVLEKQMEDYPTKEMKNRRIVDAGIFGVRLEGGIYQWQNFNIKTYTLNQYREEDFYQE